MPKYSLADAVDDAFRLRRALVQISEKSPSHVRSVVDQFMRHIAPSMARYGGADFPFTCRHHPLNAERYGGGVGGKLPTMYFHIGNTIMGFYSALITGDPTALHARLILLESIARDGIESFDVEGDEGIGYGLSKSAKVPVIEPIDD